MPKHSTPYTPDLFESATDALAEARSRGEVCRQCGRHAGYTAPGRGPHFAELRCLAGHHMRWLFQQPNTGAP